MSRLSCDSPIDLDRDVGSPQTIRKPNTSSRLFELSDTSDDDSLSAFPSDTRNSVMSIREVIEKSVKLQEDEEVVFMIEKMDDVS